MRAKKIWVIFITSLTMTMFMGCGQSNDSMNDSLSELSEWARQEGYNECYIELAYGTDMGISEENYNAYLNAKMQYFDNSTLENLKNLSKATQKVLKDLPE